MFWLVVKYVTPETPPETRGVGAPEVSPWPSMPDAAGPQRLRARRVRWAKARGKGLKVSARKTGSSK